MMVQNPNVCNSFEGLENAENAIAVDSKKASIEVIILDDSEDEDVVELTAALEELTRDEEKASAANGVTLPKTEKRPCLDKGKNIIIEVEDDGEEFDRQAQETRKAIGESSRPMGDTETEVEDNDQTLGFLEPSRNLNRGPPCDQTVMLESLVQQTPCGISRSKGVISLVAVLCYEHFYFYYRLLEDNRCHGQ
ncbi:hypothetical protein POM88_034299 [Heracleum sosnowskyi]|uniref:Uncharacterized protein n=1 Tax=Heracleum sosnowskyi TaxID=360622 RepID=A0AAD8MCU7_9APIA|nr:hypothetical protein POM88_034299 [Heracleum sosnowskyi]